MTHSDEVAGDPTREPRRRRSRRRLLAGLLLALALLAASAAAAQAAGPAKVNTNGRARSELLLGRAGRIGQPEREQHVLLLPVRADESLRLADGDRRRRRRARKAVPVRLAITGLQPLTVYHYRLVAVNSSGATIGDDEKLLTTKVPLSLAILASPNPVTFGGLVTVQGTLSGTGNASRAVVLQANAVPLHGGLSERRQCRAHDRPTGGFNFVVLNQTSRRSSACVTTPNKPVVSPVTTENVAVRVSSHVARTKRRGFARFYGTVTPAVDGAQVGVLRIAQGHGILAGGHGGQAAATRGAASSAAWCACAKAPTACSSRSRPAASSPRTARRC